MARARGVHYRAPTSLTLTQRESLRFAVEVEERDDRRWMVGELAQVTGLTVRALHHYDKIGLLRPSERTAAGYRLYSSADVERLYRITVLRGLGLSLEQIAEVLDGETWQLEAAVRQHLEDVQRQLQLGERLGRRLRQMLAALHRSDVPSPEEIIDTLELMAMQQNAAHVSELQVSVPPERVWKALTEPELTRRHYFASAVESDWEPGSSLTYRGPNGEPIVEGEILEIEPPRRLVSTFVPRWDPSVAADAPTQVAWEIEPSRHGSRVRLTHSGLQAGSTTHRDAPSGWAQILSSLKALLETDERAVGRS